MKEITIAILSHNRSFLLTQAVGSIRQFTRYPYRILIHDNASDENHKEHIAQLAADDCSIIWSDKFYSCVQGRREFLRYVETERLVYMDDDEKVGPKWLTNMVAVMNRFNCGAVVGNLVHDDGRTYSGARMVRGREILVKPIEYRGQCDAAAGGCTLYDRDVLDATEYRPEFSGGFEDWDQTLQITRDLGRTIYASPAVFFHNHGPLDHDYYVDRWRYTEVMDAAVGIWKRWRIKTAVTNTAAEMLKRGVPFTKEQADVFSGVMSL